MSQPPEAGRDDYDQAEPQRMTRNVPPLAWIILALLLAAMVVAAVMRRDTHVTPQGEAVPQAAQGETYMPAAPASGDAPSTPGVVVNER